MSVSPMATNVSVVTPHVFSQSLEVPSPAHRATSADLAGVTEEAPSDQPVQASASSLGFSAMRDDFMARVRASELLSATSTATQIADPLPSNESPSLIPSDTMVHEGESGSSSSETVVNTSSGSVGSSSAAGPSVFETVCNRLSTAITDCVNFIARLIYPSAVEDVSAQGSVVAEECNGHDTSSVQAQALHIFSTVWSRISNRFAEMGEWLTSNFARALAPASSNSGSTTTEVTEASEYPEAACSLEEFVDENNREVPLITE